MSQNDAVEQRKHWTRCFIAACLKGGSSVDEAIAKGREVADKLFGEDEKK